MPSLAEVASFLSAIAAVGAVLMSWRNSKKIEQVHVSINSRMDQLLKARGDASMAAGVEQGRSEGRPAAHEEPAMKVEITKIPPMPSL